MNGREEVIGDCGGNSGGLGRDGWLGGTTLEGLGAGDRTDRDGWEMSKTRKELTTWLNNTTVGTDKTA